MIPLEKQAMDSLLIFTVGGYSLAVDISEVESIIEVPIITSIPMLPDFVSGTFPFHGKVVTAIELRKKLEVVTDCVEKSVVVVSLIDKSLFGFKVDSVDTLAKYDDFNLAGAKTIVSGIKVCSSENYGIVLLTSFEKLLDMGKGELQTLDSSHLAPPSTESARMTDQEVSLTHSSETSLSDLQQTTPQTAQKSAQELAQEDMPESAQAPVQEAIPELTQELAQEVAPEQVLAQEATPEPAQELVQEAVPESAQIENSDADCAALDSSPVEQQVTEASIPLNTEEDKTDDVVLVTSSNEERVSKDSETFFSSQLADNNAADELYEYALGLLDAEDNAKSTLCLQEPPRISGEFDDKIIKYNKPENTEINEIIDESIDESPMDPKPDEIKIGEEFDEAIPLKIDKPFPLSDNHFPLEAENNHFSEVASGLESEISTSDNVKNKNTQVNGRFARLDETHYLQEKSSVLENDNFYAGKKYKAEKRPNLFVYGVSIIIVLGIAAGLYGYYSSGESASTFDTHIDTNEPASSVVLSPSQSTHKEDDNLQPQENAKLVMGDTRHQAVSENLSASASSLVTHTRDKPTADSVRVLQIESPKYTISVDRPIDNTANTKLEKKVIQIKPKTTFTQIATASQLFKDKTHSSGDTLVTHTVIKGDTLWRLAGKYLNNPFRYPELAELSDILNPDLIYPGDRVTFWKKIPNRPVTH